MCEYCHSFPHLPGCPNAPEPAAVYECEYCGRGIYPGDYYTKFYAPRGGFDYYHWDCLLEMNPSELMDVLDIGNDDILADRGFEMEECKEDDE